MKCIYIVDEKWFSNNEGGLKALDKALLELDLGRAEQIASALQESLDQNEFSHLDLDDNLLELLQNTARQEGAATMVSALGQTHLDQHLSQDLADWIGRKHPLNASLSGMLSCQPSSSLVLLEV